MIRVHTIDGKRLLTKILLIIFLMVTCYLTYRMILISGSQIQPDSFSQKINPVDSTTGVNIGTKTYRTVIQDVIPHMKEYENQSASKGIIQRTFQVFTQIDFDHLGSILEQTIPTLKYLKENGEDYILTVAELNPDIQQNSDNEQLIVQNELDIFEGITQDEDYSINHPIEQQEPEEIKTIHMQNEFNDMDYLLKHFYTVNSTITPSIEDFPVETFINKNLSINKQSNGPQILIFHTHSQEDFKDSRPGRPEDRIVGVGQTLADLLENEYGIETLHHTGEYDVVNGKPDRDGSYERMEPFIREILRQNPSIEVVIDLHRDGLPENIHLVTEINGKPTAKVMFFNGICKSDVPSYQNLLKQLQNPYLEDNLSFSFQMQLQANETYPGFTRKIFIKDLRYSLHMMPKSLLIEVGAQTNTVEEAKNAMEPLAELLARVLKVKS